MHRLTGGVEKLARIVIRHWARSPHGFQLTLARSVLAASTVVVLTFNRASVLLHDPTTARASPTSCDNLASLGAFCIASAEHLEQVRWLLILLCAPALLGLVPAVAAPLHAYAAFTVASNTVGIEGGDFLVASSSLIMVVVCATDCRLHGWSARSSARPASAYIPAQVFLLGLRVQVAYVYLEAATVKQVHPIWADGSALWYWTQQPNFGARPEVRDLLEVVLAQGSAVHALTWGVIVTEYVLAFAVLAARRRLPRLLTLALGVSMHLVFALVLGLITFFVSMLGVLLLVTWRAGDAMPWKLFRLVRSTSRVREGAPLRALPRLR